MKLIGLMVFSLMIASQSIDDQKVESTFDKKATFGSYRTYTLTRGYDAYRPDVHKMIVESVETEMTGLGFTKVTSGADVTLAYYTVASMTVDIKDLDKVEREASEAGAPTKTLGRLAVIMRSATSNQQLWSASTRGYVDSDPVKLAEVIRSVTARLFETYPGRKPASSK
jgi:hypothetical protein